MNHNLIVAIGFSIGFLPLILVAKKIYPFDEHRPFAGLCLIFLWVGLTSWFVMLPAMGRDIVEQIEEEKQVCLPRPNHYTIYSIIGEE